jgi:hypothetical protein
MDGLKRAVKAAGAGIVISTDATGTVGTASIVAGTKALRGRLWSWIADRLAW